MASYVFAQNVPAAEYDRSLAWAALLLVVTGLVMVYSASSSTAEASRYTGQNPAYYLLRHAAFLGVSLAAAIGVFLLPMRLWQQAAPWLFLAALALLVCVLIPGIGREVNGARRWISLYAVNVQPSEPQSSPLFSTPPITQCASTR
jgi:cell division protein FtsW